MVIIKFIILLLMFIGLLCTLAPRLHGTVIILLAGLLYIVYLAVQELQFWMIGVFTLTVIAELGSIGLRRLLTRKKKISRMYSIDTSVCNLAGIIVMDAFLGSFLGTTIWGLLVSKNLLPDVDDMRQIVTRLLFIAMLRSTCGTIMIGLIIAYTM